MWLGVLSTLHSETEHELLRDPVTSDPAWLPASRTQCMHRVLAVSQGLGILQFPVFIPPLHEDDCEVIGGHASRTPAMTRV